MVSNGPPISVQNESADITDNLATSSGNATLVTSGSIETLTIPVNIEFKPDIGFIDDMYLSGDVVAVATLPEPHSASLVALCALVIIRKRPRA